LNRRSMCGHSMNIAMLPASTCGRSSRSRRASASFALSSAAERPPLGSG
jgi:hypothetical protein